MIDAGDLFMVEFVPGEFYHEPSGYLLVIVVEPDYRGTGGWLCEFLHSGQRFVYHTNIIEEGKILLAQQTTYR